MHDERECRQQDDDDVRFAHGMVKGTLDGDREQQTEAEHDRRRNTATDNRVGHDVHAQDARDRDQHLDQLVRDLKRNGRRDVLAEALQQARNRSARTSLERAIRR